MSKRAIGVLTTGRQDWGIVHSTCTALRDHQHLALRLIAGGTHGASGEASSIDVVRGDGFEPDVILPWDQGSTPGATAAVDVGAARTIEGLGAALRSYPIEALLIVGDRYETAAAAIAATIARVPLIHVHGGEQTLGAFDDSLRHAITKLSHLHLVSHPEHRARVIAMGEDPDSVHVVGAPGLDAAARPDLPDREELAAAVGLPLEPPVVIVTVHPATLEADPAATARAVAAAMDEVDASYVVTLPNTDPGSADVRRILAKVVAGSPRRVAVEALGERGYWGMMRIADAMLGNSSSALLEAPALALPAVNVGERQAGRRHEANILHSPADSAAVATTLRRALDPATRQAMRAACHLPADGKAGRRIVDIISAWQAPNPPRKPPIRIQS